MRQYLERALRTAAAAVAAMVCTVSPAQAAFYSGAWDPAFGAPFTKPPFAYNLGWKGDVEVFVDDNCVPSPDTSSTMVTTILIGNSCAPSSSVVSRMESAKVDLYTIDAYDPFGPSFYSAGAIIDTLEFDPLSISVLAVRFTGTELTGLLTWPSEWVLADLQAFSLYRYFSLAFTLPEVSAYLSLVTDKIPAEYNGPLLLSSIGDLDEIKSLEKFLLTVLTVKVSDVAENEPQNFSFARIDDVNGAPEPGSLALVALALFATAWAARRRRRT